MNATGRRVAETAGMLMIGDGVLGALRPAEHCLLWRGGPQWWRNTIDWFARHPAMTRAAAVAEVAAGVWCAQQSFGARQLGAPGSGGGVYTDDTGDDSVLVVIEDDQLIDDAAR
jgi:hypothetical protein